MSSRSRILSTRAALAISVLALLLMLSGCAGANPAEVADGAGFWRGLVHGAIAPISFVVSLFRDDVSVYAISNNGGWYDAGFLIGVSAWHGGAAGNRHLRRRRTDRREDAR